MSHKKPCGAVQYEIIDHTEAFMKTITIDVQKSLHINLTVVKFDSIYTGSLDLHCFSYGMMIRAVSTDSRTKNRIVVCVGDAIFTRTIHAHKVECIIKNKVVNSKLSISFLYQVSAWSSLTYIKSDPLFAMSNFKEFKLNLTNNLYSFQQPFMLSRISIHTTYDKQINISAYVNRHCTDAMAATKLFDGPMLRYDLMICKMNSWLVNKDMVQLFSYLGTHVIMISYLEDTSYTDVHYHVEYKMQEIKAIDTNLALQERYILNINTEHTDVYQQQWLITSPYSIKLTMLKNRRFAGYTYNCQFGAFHLIEITNYRFEREFGPFCSSDFGIPLMDGKSWYIGQRSARFTIWAYRGYFDIDIDIAIELTKCEGINDVHSYLPCR